MKHDATDHPKFHALIASLALPRFQAVGILECLWHLAQKFAPDNGNLSRFSPSQIAAYLGWPADDTDRLVEALVATGWLDRDAAGGLSVHDWRDHRPRYLIESERLRNKRQPQPNVANSCQQLPTVANNTPLNPTQPNPTQPEYKPTPHPRKRGPSSGKARRASSSPSPAEFRPYLDGDKAATPIPDTPYGDLLRFYRASAMHYGPPVLNNLGRQIKAIAALRADGCLPPGVAPADVIERYFADADPWFVNKRHPLSLMLSTVERWAGSNGTHGRAAEPDRPLIQDFLEA